MFNFLLSYGMKPSAATHIRIKDDLASISPEKGNAAKYIQHDLRENKW